MGILKRHFPFGLGTSRFPISGPGDAKGIEASVKLVLRALEAGVDYIDIGYSYSAGVAMSVLKRAFQETKRPFGVTVKVQYGKDYTAADTQKRVMFYLESMGLKKAQYFTCWSIQSYDEFEKIMEKGGIYDGALKLRSEGLIDHICASLHAAPEEMIKIIESGAFEAVTVSYSLLNAAQMQPVLDAAYQKNVSVIVMNPLGGGIIPQAGSYFSFACLEKDEGNIVHAALRFAKAHPAVDIVLGGVSAEAELKDSLGIFTSEDTQAAVRLPRVLEQAGNLEGFCTGCRYCEGCPKGIPTYALMQAGNALLFPPVPSYNRQQTKALLYDLQIFRKLYFDYDWLPDSGENPCVQCGKCERSCTQKLGIIKEVADIYRRIKQRGYSVQARRKKIEALICGQLYKKIGLYPSSVVANEIISYCEKYLERPDIEWLLFNSSQALWGPDEYGRIVHSPEEIEALRPEMILITTYRYDDEIARSLKVYEKQGIKVQRFYSDSDVPWTF